MVRWGLRHVRSSGLNLVTILLVVAVVTVLVPTHAQASANGKKASVRGVTCRVYAQNPHASYDSRSNRIINSKLRFGECNGPVSSIRWKGQLQKCFQRSYGCDWTALRQRSGTIYSSPSGLKTRYVSRSCGKSARYRLRGKITIYKGGSSDSSSWDHSGVQWVSC